jgi:phosphatidate cytidylyltransferase
MSGLAFAACFLAAIFWPGTGGAVFFLTLCVVLNFGAFHEFFSLSERVIAPGFRRWTPVLAAAFVLAVARTSAQSGAGAAGPLPHAALGVFLLGGAVLALREREPRKGFSAFLVSCGGFLLLAWTLSAMPRLYFDGGGSSGRLLVLYLVLVTKLADVGAYTVGTLTARRPAGNHKIAPSISPKKSWEGLAGGVAAAVATAVVLSLTLGDRLVFQGQPMNGPAHALVIGVGLTLIGFVGDLLESCLKRAAQAKDSGRIPGLGGVLDVLDSLVLTAPAFLAYLLWVCGEN